MDETLAWTSSGVGMGHLLQTRRIFWEENHNASRSWWRDIDAIGFQHWMTIDFFCNGPCKSCTVLVVSCFLLETKGLLGPFWQAIRTQGKHLTSLRLPDTCERTDLGEDSYTATGLWSYGSLHFIDYKLIISFWCIQHHGKQRMQTHIPCFTRTDPSEDCYANNMGSSLKLSSI